MKPKAKIPVLDKAIFKVCKEEFADGMTYAEIARDRSLEGYTTSRGKTLKATDISKFMLKMGFRGRNPNKSKSAAAKAALSWGKTKKEEWDNSVLQMNAEMDRKGEELANAISPRSPWSHQEPLIDYQAMQKEGTLYKTDLDQKYEENLLKDMSEILATTINNKLKIKLIRAFLY